jgi:hypothetical protein
VLEGMEEGPAGDVAAQAVAWIDCKAEELGPE